VLARQSATEVGAATRIGALELRAVEREASRLHPDRNAVTRALDALRNCSGMICRGVDVRASSAATNSVTRRSAPSVDLLYVGGDSS
jgi:hypothetical protein